MRTILTLLLSITLSQAQTSTSNEEPASDPKQAAIEKLFSAMTPDELPSALETARKAGVNQQVILEGHFLHLVDHDNFKAMAALVPELLKQKDQFNPDNSEIFAVKEDWLAIIHYAQALAALEQKDKASFKKHITEAFWLSPRQGQAFTPHINRLRMKEAMAKITLKPELELQPQDGSKAITLGQLMKDKQGAVLHFWSPMSQEVHQYMDEFIHTSQQCTNNKLAVISVLVGYNDFVLKDAEIVRKEDAKNAGCSWIKDPKQGSLTNLLRITDIPTMVVISSEGKILYNGHPSKSEFWDNLQTIAPKIERPAKTNNNLPGHTHDEGCTH
ncbi:hypothetical protein HW115_00355 [Verrucomicrobiaceae bacterium N1E253]|uniref:Thioredoxin domain-containing protein n=1 Tax=Oceaniferula marina TaxID=2748318 RepID=A0A851GFI3_9BACT|nr:hypothetical protein [Oceaniferula marina]NWK54045.1 hypothetical protein [Oceaniferula marina]